MGTKTTFYYLFKHYSCNLSVLPAQTMAPPPRVKIEMPSEGTLTQDLTVTVSVNAWHSNFDISEVRVLPDPSNSTASIYGKMPVILELKEGKSRSAWLGWQVNRITWPRSKQYKFTVPVKEMASEGILKTGELRGNIAVTVVHARPNTHRKYGGVSRSGYVTASITFAVRLN